MRRTNVAGRISIPIWTHADGALRTAQTTATFEMYPETHSGKVCCTLLGHPIVLFLVTAYGQSGGVSRFIYMGDLMHGGELGPLLHLHGSTVDELISRGGPMYGGNTAAGLDNFKSALPGAYAEAAVDKRIQSVSEKMVRADAQTYPELKVKASESRHL